MDAGAKGPGAHLLQCEHPVYFLERIDNGEIPSEADQKPLETMLPKVWMVQHYVQTILMKSFIYDFVQKYLPGENNQLADVFRRCIYWLIIEVTNCSKFDRLILSILALWRRNNCDGQINPESH